ncbi:MAG: tetratricopeptide repeat protein [Pseudomonadales bacterium]|jgi:Flp pilus assembly protein TadD
MRSDLLLLPRLTLAGAVLLFAVGCASTGSGPDTKAGKASEPAKSHPMPTLSRDGDLGFSVTEVVRIDSDVRRDYQQALGLLHAGQLEAGIDLLESVVARAPDVTNPYIDLGVAYAELDQLDKAEENLKSALSLAPNHPAALNEMGIVYRRTGRFADARESYEKALTIYPGFHYALLNLGVLCDLYLDDLTCALNNYERYADIVTDDDEVGIWIADIKNRLEAGQE